MISDDKKDFWAVLLIAMLGGIGLVALVALCLWRSEPTLIVVDGRRWESWTYVRYDVTTTTLVTVSEMVCSGFGENRSCTLQTHLEPRTTTTTYTRCTSKAEGIELPVTYPPPACEMWYDDYLVHSDARVVAYHLEDQDEGGERRFTAGLWDDLEPGTVVTVQWNGFGTIVKAEGK